jgi:hypothetical protein
MVKHIKNLPEIHECDKLKSGFCIKLRPSGYYLYYRGEPQEKLYTDCPFCYKDLYNKNTEYDECGQRYINGKDVCVIGGLCHYKHGEHCKYSRKIKGELKCAAVPKYDILNNERKDRCKFRRKKGMEYLPKLRK